MLELKRTLKTTWKVYKRKTEAKREKANLQNLMTVLGREYLLNLQSELSQAWEFGEEELINYFPGASS